MPARFVDLDRQTPMFLPFDLHVSHRNKQAFKAAFVSVLQLAQHLRLSKVGTVSVDGTKLQANASKHAAVSYARAGEMIAQLELEVRELVA